MIREGALPPNGVVVLLLEVLQILFETHQRDLFHVLDAWTLEGLVRLLGERMFMCRIQIVQISARCDICREASMEN